MRVIAGLFAVCLATSATAESGISTRDNNFAVVIGNGDYRKGRLENTIPDARRMAKSLESVGFKVEYYEDLDRRALIDAISTYGDQAEKSEQSVGFFYYAGHAMRINGKNYLLPLGARIEHETEVEHEAVSLARLTSRIGFANNKANIAVLDACRNNPFRSFFKSPQEGLAPTLGHPNTLIAFSTAAGKVAADDGRYARSLSKHLLTPGILIESVFRRVAADMFAASSGDQVPWIQASLSNEVVLTDDEEPIFVDPVEIEEEPIVVQPVVSVPVIIEEYPYPCEEINVPPSLQALCAIGENEIFFSSDVGDILVLGTQRLLSDAGIQFGTEFNLCALEESMGKVDQTDWDSLLPFYTGFSSPVPTDITEMAKYLDSSQCDAALVPHYLAVQLSSQLYSPKRYTFTEVFGY